MKYDIFLSNPEVLLSFPSTKSSAAPEGDIKIRTNNFPQFKHKI